MSSDARPRTILFYGDSITDAGRRTDPQELGDGYVRVIAEHLAQEHPEIRVVNRGIGGNRTGDLIDRLDADCIDENPDVVTIMIGINDVWRRYDDDDATSPEQFEANLRTILTGIRDRAGASLVILEPFLLPVADKLRFREDLDPKIAIERRLAAEFGATFIPLDDLLARHGEQSSPEAIAGDGIHPSPDGHRIIAEAWLDGASALLRA
ncbi:SGNH/GDSL hydrolase family protein [Microbacterium sp. CIAB417]|uniref:SGNH/GDSL hydrolase family protein n=1 Tax=Microbacterium sp. CIAB417 TaxID=2860287 RepID=UPI001FAC726A|nr:SGNH/GDSL hydrolase family protein [Microbacterium sp. CIAB417]